MKNDVVTMVNVGANAALAVGDINGDLQLDAMIGNAAGQVYYYPSSHLIGDIDRSGKVDAGDLILLNQSLGLCKGDPGYNPGADLDGDNCVTASDQTILLNNFGVTY
jgi:hypothetical protein